MCARKRKQKKTNIFQQISSHQKFPQFLGFVFILVAVLLLVAFLSYINTWEIDHSRFRDASFLVLFDSSVAAANSLGRLGAYLSHLFFYRLFGVSSFILVFLLLMTGFKFLLPKAKVDLGRLVRNSIWLLLLGSTVLAFVFRTQMFPYGGGFGTTVAKWLYSFMGFTGTAILLLFFVLLTCFFLFDLSINFSAPKWKSSSRRKQQLSFKRYTEGFKGLGSSISSFFAGVGSTTQKKPKKETVKTGRTPVTPNTSAGLRQGGRSISLSPEVDEPKPKIDPRTESQLMLDINVGPVQQEQEEDPIAKADQPLHLSDEDYDPTRELAGFTFPKLDMLEMYGQDLYDPEMMEINEAELKSNKNMIVETLGNYKIEISKIMATVGPTITLYEIVPAPGIRISKIKNLEDDIALSLAALGIRIIAPIPGKGTVGIEVPNKKKEIVSLRSVLTAPAFKNSKMQLPIGLGYSISNGIYVADLAKMPHLLMAGATGQGKSVGLNAIIVSLLYKKHPAELKFVLIDPKMVELSIYSKIKNHYLAQLPGEEDAIVTDTSKVVTTLNALCVEMDSRYKLLKEAQVRDIKDYNRKFVKRVLNPKKGHRFLPYMVMVIDEYADLVMTAGKEIELPVARLAQKARAIGIHLIIATQRPTVNIITGTIKANFPARIAFKVSSKIDSKTILDMVGADQLIGRGDMLISLGGNITRLQCAFIDTPEVDRITNFIGDQQGFDGAFMLPEYLDEISASSSGGGAGTVEWDTLFEEAARLVVVNQQGSTSMIQRRLKLGYNRAGRIMDQLEIAGVVGPNLGSKVRDVLMPDEFELEKHLNQLFGR